MADQGTLYAVVDFDGAAHRTVRQVVIFFEDACAADRYAMRCGYPDYLIAPVVFDLPGPTTSTGRPGPAPPPDRRTPSEDNFR